MPIINGIDAAKVMNFNYPNILMLAITMHTKSFFLKNIIEAGFNDFIHKLDIAKNFNQVINNVLDNTFYFPDNLKITN